MTIQWVVAFILDLKRNLSLPFSFLFSCQVDSPMLGLLAAERFQLALINYQLAQDLLGSRLGSLFGPEP